MAEQTVCSEEELIKSLEENKVPFGIAIKYVRDILWKGKKPNLPGLLESPHAIDIMTVGTVYTGIVEDKLLKKHDKKFYEDAEEVDVSPILYGKASKAFQTSNVKRTIEHEKLFKQTVAEDLSQRIIENDHANLFLLGIGSGEDGVNILQKLSDVDSKKVTIYGIDAFPNMLKKSLDSKLTEFDYHPIVADMKHLPFREINGVLTINTNTKGNFTRSERENLDSLIADRMGEGSALYESVYYSPKGDYKKWLTANDYNWFSNWVMHVAAGFRQVTNSGDTIDQQDIESVIDVYSDLPKLAKFLGKDLGEYQKIPKEKVKEFLGVEPMTMEEFVRNPHFMFVVYNKHTNNVETYVSPFINGRFENEPIFRSHRFTEKELRNSAQKANLNIELLDDKEEGMYIVKLIY